MRTLRLHQWVKNVLVVLPLIMAHRVGDIRDWLNVMLCFLAFCFTASAVYVINDLSDLPADRQHKSKRHRPLAAGGVAIPTAALLVVGLLLLAALIAAFLPAAFAAMLLLYFVLTTCYSFFFKHKLMVDVICLAGLYTLRIMAGGAAVAVPISPWLLAFSMFFFLSMAFVKCYTELESQTDRPTYTRIKGRGYMPIDLELIQSVGPASGYICVLIMCLYINSPDVVKLYPQPQFLWLICPILLYWISRVWFLARRRQMADDPIVFAIKDKNSYMALAIIAVIMALAIWS